MGHLKTLLYAGTPIERKIFSGQSAGNFLYKKIPRDYM
jgi:hypothetical protein